MKVKVLKRDPLDYVRETRQDIHKVSRSFAPDQHPFEAPREYQRAVNAAKLDRIFAKPFIGAITGHRDGVSSVKLHPTRLSIASSCSYDGEVLMWDLSTRNCVLRCAGHPRSYARDVEFAPNANGEKLYSVGDDKRICLWNTSEKEMENYIENKKNAQPVDVIQSKGILTGLSHHRYENTLATCGEVVTVWDTELRTSLNEYQWGVDTVHDIKFNQIEPNLLGACASDRSILLYDTRERNPMRKVILDLKSNRLCWNPMEAFVFSVANEDYNVYAFDIRKLRRPVNVHMDHTAAVTALQYSPTGREIVTGGYDKTIRIFKTDEGHSREVYHTKRMQRLTCVAWTLDNRYILSGSDEMNLRLWKARASEKLGILKDREKASIEYAEKLKEKFGAYPQVRKIVKTRHLPKHVLNAQREHRVIKDSANRKDANRRRHSKPGAVPHVPERQKHVVKEEI